MQQQFDFVTQSPKLGTRDREGYYCVFLSIHTRVPDPDEEWSDGFSVQYITKHHSRRLCVVVQSAGKHVLDECVRRYTEEYTSDDNQYVRHIVGREEIMRVEVSYTYPEADVEVFEIH